MRVLFFARFRKSHDFRYAILHSRSATYSAKYRDGQGIVRRVTTGCRDEGAARSVLGELERRGELVRSGVLTAGEDRIADHAATPIAEHFDAYGEHLQAKGCCKVYRENTRRHLDRLAADCRFSRLGDFDRTAVERWLADSFQ